MYSLVQWATGLQKDRMFSESSMRNITFSPATILPLLVTAVQQMVSRCELGRNYQLTWSNTNALSLNLAVHGIEFFT